MHGLGRLVKIAQTVEDEVDSFRLETESRVKAKFKEVRAEWLELRSRTPRSSVNKYGLRGRAFLIRSDAQSRRKLAMVIGKTIMKLEEIRSWLLRSATH